MYFQDKFVETTQDLRARAASLGKAALIAARERAGLAANRVEMRVAVLKTSLSTLGVAGRELEKVARRHGSKFLKQNVTIAQAARKDVTTLARSTIETFAKRAAPAKAKTRKSVARKTTSRVRAKAA